MELMQGDLRFVSPALAMKLGADVGLCEHLL